MNLRDDSPGAFALICLEAEDFSSLRDAQESIERLSTEEIFSLMKNLDTLQNIAKHVICWERSLTF